MQVYLNYFDLVAAVVAVAAYSLAECEHQTLVVALAAGSRLEL